MRFIKMMLRLSVPCMLLTACRVSDSIAMAPRWEAGPSGEWHQGDFHVHTSVGSNDTRTDGVANSWPDTVKAIAIERGMDFVIITDHSNSAGSITTTTREDGRTWNQGPEFPVWDTAAALSDLSFLMLDGSEISPVSTLQPNECDYCSSTGTGEAYPVGHIGCFPADLATFDTTGVFTDRPPGAVTGKRGIDKCHAMGGLAVVNHPYPNVTPWIEYDWTSFDYDAIEVWNGGVGWDTFDAAAYDAYLCDRLAGRKVVAVGGSDNHRTLLPYIAGNVNFDPPLGLPMTSIFSKTFVWKELVTGFQAGRIVVHDKDTFVDFRVYASRGYLGGVGDEVARSRAQGVSTVWLKGKSKGTQAVQLWHVAPGACTETRRAGNDKPPTVIKQVVYEAEFEGAFDWRATLSLREGLYFAIVGPFETKSLNIRNVAVTNVFTISK